jgi:long-chain acyl-CoA synthetase
MSTEIQNMVMSDSVVDQRQSRPVTIAEIILKAAAEFDKPDALNYKDGERWQSISSKEFVHRAELITLGLYSLGIRQGDRVAILSQNCYQWTITDVGCLFGGYISVPLYATQAPEQVQYILNDSESRVLFVEDEAAFTRVRDFVSNCRSLEKIIFFRGKFSDSSLSFSELESLGRDLLKQNHGLVNDLRRSLTSEDMATIIYTSGTTGEPKGVMLTNQNIVSNLEGTAGHLQFTKEEVALSVLPLSHVLERMGMFMYISRGMSVYYAESLEKIGDNIREVRPTFLIAVPRLYEKIYARIKEKARAGGTVKVALLSWAVEVGKEWARRVYNRQDVPASLKIKHKLASRLIFSKWHEGTGGRLRFLVSGGSALSEEIGYIFAGAGLPILEGYGLTETSPVITVNSPASNRIGTVGQPLPNVQVRIAPDGEIETRGPNVMVGYYRKPAETRAVLTDDGWFKTGDIGTLDKDGYLKITDRKKELFKTSGGKYIAPQPIEQRIKSCPYVNQVVLVGSERRFPAALIVPNWDQIRTLPEFKSLPTSTSELVREPQLIEFFQKQVDSLTENLSKYERVKRVALIENELTIDGGELTPSMKVKRRVVDQKYRKLIDQIYSETPDTECG